MAKPFIRARARQGVRGLVVGRFQPFHKGHQALIDQAIEDCVNVVVAIGSADAKQDARNPFTTEERIAMLRAVYGDRVEIVPVPDLHDAPRWAAHVIRLTGPVDRVFGNNERDLLLFEQARLETVQNGLVERDAYEATRIRVQVAEDDRAWRQAVPKSVVALLDAMEAGKRLRLIEARA